MGVVLKCSRKLALALGAKEYGDMTRRDLAKLPILVRTEDESGKRKMLAWPIDPALYANLGQG